MKTNLKATLLTLLVFSFYSPAKGQSKNDIPRNSIGISYQKIDIGQGMQIDYGRALWKKWQLNAGLYIHFNSLPRDDQNYSYHNRGWAEKWYNHLGVNVSIQRTILEHDQTKLYTFYNAHVLKTGFRDKIYETRITPQGDIYRVLNEGYIFDPMYTWENTIGLGISTHLSEHIGFNVRGGLGFSLFYDPYAFPSGMTKVFGTYNYGGMAMMSTGVFYTF